MRNEIAGSGTAKQKESLEEILSTNNQLDQYVEGLEERLGRVMQSHEYQYMQAYNIQVKRKEQELL